MTYRARCNGRRQRQVDILGFRDGHLRRWQRKIDVQRFPHEKEEDITMVVATRETYRQQKARIKAEHAAERVRRRPPIDAPYGWVLQVVY